MNASSNNINTLTDGWTSILEGLTTDRIWLSGGRIGLSIASHAGIEEIVYWGDQNASHTKIFRAPERTPYFNVLRPYIVIGTKSYVLEPKETQLYPSGYVSKFNVPKENVTVEHSLVLRSEDILQTLRVLQNDDKLPIRLRVCLSGGIRMELPDRRWRDWEADASGQGYRTSILDTEGAGDVTTYFGVVSDQPLSKRVFHFGKEVFETDAIESGTVTVAAVFARSVTEFELRYKECGTFGSVLSCVMVSEWNSALTTYPKLSIGNAWVESFFRQSPLLLKSLMLPDLPGGMRASAAAYWVWGWDTMVHCDAYLLAGQHEFVKDALELYRRTADPEKGIGHSFDSQMHIGYCQAPAAQGLYIQMLYHFLAHTGDVETMRRFYPFAKRIFERAVKLDYHDGLLKGRSLWPDEPQYVGHNGHDISVFNNSIFYQAARCLEYLAGALDDTATATDARKVWLQIETAFRNRFWDDEVGYWLDSIDSRNGSTRKSYPAYAILWTTQFARDLVYGREARCAKFVSENLLCAGGIRPYPTWDPSFNADGNQCSQYYPSAFDSSFTSVAACCGYDGIGSQYLGWIEAHWSRNTVPEGTSLESENGGAQLPDNPGCKQAFTGKAWYNALLHAAVGVSFDAGGLTCEPAWGFNASVTALQFQDRAWHIANTGHGTCVKAIMVNGKRIVGSSKVPSDIVAAYAVSVDIERSPTLPTVPWILSADNARLSRLTSSPQSVSVHLESRSAVRVIYSSPRAANVIWNGCKVDAEYDANSGRGRVLLDPNNDGNLRGCLAIEWQK